VASARRPADWAQAPGPYAVGRNAGGAAQPRLDAVDALETHFTPPGGSTVDFPRFRGPLI
jgi:hypothetical protein